MVGLGDVANQSGGIGSYVDIQNHREGGISATYELLKDSDSILDI